MLAVLFLIAGFVALYWGAEWLVDGASDIASHLRLSKSFVGLTLVAFGTSAPELFVNLISASRGHPDLALANVVGSNLTNLCVGFGLASAFVMVPVVRKDFLIDLIMLVVAPAMVLASFATFGSLSLWALAPFAILLTGYILSLAGRRTALVAEDPTHLHLAKPLMLFVLGIVSLYLGGEVVFRATVRLAQRWEIPEAIIGLTVVACGTSVPDVTASVIAARKREFGIAVGNLLGSNISNIFVVLGGTLIAARQSLPADMLTFIDYAVVCGMSLVLAVAAAVTQRVPRLLGFSLILAFGIYLTGRVVLAVLNGDAAMAEAP